MKATEPMHGCLTDQRHAHAVLHRSVRGHLVGHQIEERLIVVGVHVVDVLRRLGRESRALTVVVQLRPLHGLAIVGRQRVVLQVARKPPASRGPRGAGSPRDAPRRSVCRGR